MQTPGLVSAAMAPYVESMYEECLSPRCTEKCRNRQIGNLTKAEEYEALTGTYVRTCVPGMWICMWVVINGVGVCRTRVYVGMCVYVKVCGNGLEMKEGKTGMPLSHVKTFPPYSSPPPSLPPSTYISRLRTHTFPLSLPLVVLQFPSTTLKSPSLPPSPLLP